MPHDQAYLEAEKKIKEARRSGATELKLSGMKLTELPESLGQLIQLQSLNLSDNQLTTLPPSLGQLTQLTNLNLGANQLTTLPLSLGQLTQLTELDFSDNQLTTLPESLGSLTQLESLRLFNNNLITLPTCLKRIKQLKELGFTENPLDKVPEWIGELNQLISLGIGGNKLSTIPESIGNLKNIVSLVIIDTLISALPESIVQLTKLEFLCLYGNQLTSLPESIGKLKKLRQLQLDGNQLTVLPKSLSNLHNLEELILGDSRSGGNPIREIPESIRKLTKINNIEFIDCNLTTLPRWLYELTSLESLFLGGNNLSELPSSLAKLEHLTMLDLSRNPLRPELDEAYKQGVGAVKLYLRAGAVVPSYEAKLILVGEGEVGKTCLMDALLDKEWREHPSTHGIEIQQIKVTINIEEYNDDIVPNDSDDEIDNMVDIDSTEQDIKKEITLNCWDFGGQRVYRPTHQLFFSAPAVYLVVWKPREGPQQGFVKEWIQLVKRREPSAKILVIATHGGPGQRQPDIDRQELWDTFGKETVVDFFFVESKPDEQGNRKGIDELKRAIAQVAASLPEVGRSVPKSFADVREALQTKNVPYLPLDEVLAICHEHKMADEIANLFITISHRLGHLTHYENDPALHDIVILRPDWLSSAMSYILDDEVTRHANGLVDFSRLGLLWNDQSRPAETRYPQKLHRIFLRLMERFDLSYRVAGLSPNEESNPVSLIAQLVPDNTPEEKVFEKAWLPEISSGDIQQTQICRIVDEKGNTANAEGLFFQLIVRLHKFSLGRVHYDDSMHWQRGLVLDDDYNGRAVLRHVGNDVHITVRAPYPEFFLAMLTREIKYLVESFWEGLRCDVMVPCIEPCGRQAAGTGLYEVEKLIDSKRKGRPEFPCPVCNEWQNIDTLLRNAPAAQPISLLELLDQFDAIKDKLDVVDVNTRRILSQVDQTYTDLLQLLTDEAKEGPRLFSIFPLDRSNFNPKNWIRAQFRLVLWCEHSRLPLPVLNNGNMTKGVYDLDLDREWFKKSAPYLKLLTGTLGMVLPVASSAMKLALDKTAYELIEEQLDFSKSIIDSAIGETRIISEFMSTADSTNLESGVAVRAENATLRELHSILKEKDPGFGGLVRVMNKRQEFLWVHEKFVGEY